jgi:hypothetical protein
VLRLALNAPAASDPPQRRPRSILGETGRSGDSNLRRRPLAVLRAVGVRHERVKSL